MFARYNTVTFTLAPSGQNPQNQEVKYTLCLALIDLAVHANDHP